MQSLGCLLFCAVQVFSYLHAQAFYLPPAPLPPAASHSCRAFLVQQWIHQWGRFLLFVAGFYWIPVRGWANMRAAEAER